MCHPCVDTLPCEQVATYRSSSTYALWQLRTLAADEPCRQAAIREGAVPVLVGLLAYLELAAGAAAVLRRLCSTPERGMAVCAAGLPAFPPPQSARERLHASS